MDDLFQIAAGWSRPAGRPAPEDGSLPASTGFLAAFNAAAPIPDPGQARDTAAPVHALPLAGPVIPQVGMRIDEIRMPGAGPVVATGPLPAAVFPAMPDAPVLPPRPEGVGSLAMGDTVPAGRVPPVQAVPMEGFAVGGGAGDGGTTPRDGAADALAGDGAGQVPAEAPPARGALPSPLLVAALPSGVGAVPPRDAPQAGALASDGMAPPAAAADPGPPFPVPAGPVGVRAIAAPVPARAAAETVAPPPAEGPVGGGADTGMARGTPLPDAPAPPAHMAALRSAEPLPDPSQPHPAVEASAPPRSVAAAIPGSAPVAAPPAGDPMTVAARRPPPVAGAAPGVVVVPGPETPAAIQPGASGGRDGTARVEPDKLPGFAPLQGHTPGPDRRARLAALAERAPLAVPDPAPPLAVRGPTGSPVLPAPTLAPGPVPPAPGSQPVARAPGPVEAAPVGAAPQAAVPVAGYTALPDPSGPADPTGAVTATAPTLGAPIQPGTPVHAPAPPTPAIRRPTDAAQPVETVRAEPVTHPDAGPVVPAVAEEAGAGLSAPGASDARVATAQPTPGAPPPAAPAQGLSRQLAQALTERQGSEGVIEIALDPPELGRVRLSFAEAGGALTLSITADRPETADLMRRHLSLLAQEFQKAGLDAPSVDISDRHGGSRRDGRAEPDTPLPIPAAGPDPGVVTPPPRMRRGGGDGLDLRL